MTFLTRGSGAFVKFVIEPPIGARGAAGGPVLAIAANAERIDAASGEFVELETGMGSIEWLEFFKTSNYTD
jgi:hypothetical protein